MSQSNLEDEASRKNYTQPHSGRHKIPTIQGYREHRKELEGSQKQTEEAQHDPQDDSKTWRAYGAAKTILKGEDEDQKGGPHNPYPVANHNDEERPRQQQTRDVPQGNDGEQEEPERNKHGKHKSSKQQDKSATEQAAGAIDPREKRKAMKKRKQAGGREVTDPVTHLPIVIYDQTEKDLSSVQENEPPPGSSPRTETGGARKSREQLNEEGQESQRSYNGMQKAFPPPAFEALERDLATVYKLALTAGLSAVLLLASGALLAHWFLQSGRSTLWHLTSLSIVLLLILGAAVSVVLGVRGWLEKKVHGIWEDQTWDALRQQEAEHVGSESELPESVQWLNSMLTSVWPLINPDLFSSLVDMLEDVMQASLPKIVRMVSVDDMGQGSEAVRILGIKWLPTGAASQSVGDEGQLKNPDEKEKENSDRTTPDGGQQDQSADDGESPDEDSDAHKKEEQKKQQEQEQQAMRAGMEAEEGDFMNLELAFAYRTRSSGRSIASKAKNAHLYLKFYLPGGIAVPVWVELRGIMGIMRLRLQLTPDPPFFSICTLTFLGQPKADLSCVPLSKHSLNLMDVPLISSFVQSAIDAALAEYVAPKSLTLDLKEMLMGEDYKKDTTTRGVVWIFIKQARDFKQGDGGFGPFEGSSDSYVTVSWGKFGKPVASTRVVKDDQAPQWHEWASILVSADELNANENLRLQLWDSDKWSADDDLGRVEVDLHDLMHNEETKNRMCDREDRFKGADTEENMPGSLTWSVGYFEKTRITDTQLQKQTHNKDIRSKEELKNYVSKMAQNKLREAKLEGEHNDELHQQKVQDYKEQEDNMLISAPPSPDHRSGILSIQIHNITGLEVQKLQKQEKGDQDGDEEDESDTNLPDSYCNIIMNHKKIYKTRTKPKNAKPFFNAGTERFVKDWTTTEIIISCRDSREKEDDALLGVVFLPLRKVFEERSQIMNNYPLAGGVGSGRARISLVWRSVELQLPPNLRGWDYGTLEIKGAVRPKGDFNESLEHDRIKIRTNLSRTKLHPRDGQWQSKRRGEGENPFLAVRQRYSSAMVIEFRKTSIGPDKTPAFAVLWLSDLVDDEEETKTLKVWKGGKKNLQRAEACCDYKGLEQDEQALGEIELTMKFWRGLSGYHKQHAARSKNSEVRNVMECLDTINDEGMDEFSDEADSSDADDDDYDTATESENSPRRNRKDRSDTTTSNGNDQDPGDAATRKKLRTHTNQSDTSSEDSDVQPAESGGFSKVKAPVATVKDAISKATDKMTGEKDIQEDGSRGVRAQIQDYKQSHKQLHRKHRGIMQWRGVRTADWATGKAKRAGSKVGDLFHHGSKGQGVETEV
ncbi:hypothetical protein OHC33_006183 [Knufia fluminis]|uniref:Meiotically up-regulated gene 190 protein n=1 Tax=Knufia fluminis TaxID=191047 RepID=A0AAN8ESF8_9EURO|nr:hypothetical protein OHC33_006183 [Knufia fluminis]